MVKTLTIIALLALCFNGMFWWFYPTAAVIWIGIGIVIVKAWFWLVVIILGIRFVRDIWKERE